MTTRNSPKVIPILAAVLAALALLAPVGRAQDFSKRCDNTTHLMADGRIVEGRLGNNAGDHIVWFRFTTRPGVSYSIEAHMPVQPASATPTVDVFNEGDVDFLVQCQTGPSTVATRNTTAIAPIIRHNGMRVSVAGTGADLLVRVSAFLGQVLSMQLSETTLFNPAWSTFGTFETFYSCTNTTNDSALDATLRFFNTAGAQVGSDFNFTDIPAGGTVNTNTGTLGVANNLNGSATLTHNGPPGALLCEAAIANFAVTPNIIQPVKFEPARQMR